MFLCKKEWTNSTDPPRFAAWISAEQWARNCRSSQHGHLANLAKSNVATTNRPLNFQNLQFSALHIGNHRLRKPFICEMVWVTQLENNLKTTRKMSHSWFLALTRTPCCFFSNQKFSFGTFGGVANLRESQRAKLFISMWLPRHLDLSCTCHWNCLLFFKGTSWKDW